MSTFNIQDAIYIDADTQNVGIGDTTPSYPLDVTGDINTTTDFNVGGVQVLSATALGSAVVSSSLTSVGTLSALTVSGDLNATLTTAAQTNVTSVGTLSALTVSGNLNATLTTAAQPNVTSVGTLSSLTVSGALDVSGDIDCNSNDITNVDNISFTSATIKGHMIPDTDDTYDIGSAQFKIRDMYVSDNSLWVGDSHKVSISGGKMKFRKRISATVPAAITAAGGDEAGALTHAGKISLSLMKLHHWKAYMRTLSDQSGATIQDIFRDNAADYIEQSASDNWLETGTKTFNTIGNVGIGTADPSALLSLHYEPESSQGLKELLRLSWNDGSYDTLKGDGTKISFNTSNVNNSPGNVEGGYIGVMKANAVEANKACDYTVALNNGTSVVERLRILSTGYVGIGDSTPSYELDVTGDINLTGDLRINGTVQTFGGSSVWSEASSEAYYMGNVGIGTNNPSYQLDVRGNMRLGDGTSTEQDIRYISANGDWQLGTNNAGNGTSGNHFFLYEAGSYRFTVQKGTGNVGIGQQSPTGKLHISGSVTNTTSYSTSSPLLRLSQTNAATPWDFTAIVLETGGYNHTIGMSLNTLQLKAKGSAGYGEMEFIVGAGITTAMVIDYTGNVGIGTTSPTFNLEVVGYGGSLNTNLYGYHHAAGAWYNHSGNTWHSGTEQIGARFHSGIIAQSMYIMSDERIKTDIIEIEDDEALVQLRQLKPKKYNYTDVSTYGENQVYGFIAQEVREVLPTSCTLISNYIPNIQVSANISSIEENIVENFEENSCVLTLGVEHNLIVNDMITCRTSSGESIDDIEVTEIIDIYSIRINKTFTSEQSTFTNEEDDFVEENVIFVYGKKVDDFHNLNKDTIWTVATAALQEVDRQLQAEKTKVVNLEEKYEELEIKNKNLESELAMIKAHLGL